MNTAAIFGVGLIGGSFGLALRENGFSGTILGVSAPETIARAVARGAIDRGVLLEEAASLADLIFMAQPVRRIIQTLPKLNPYVQPDALVTDAGSTKAAIVGAARHLTRCQFLGGHPLAGKESRGVDAAEADLFRGCGWLLCPGIPAELDTPAAQGLLAWIRRIGARPAALSAEEHDQVLAFTSHLPQLASTALAAALEGTLPRSLPGGQPFGPALIDATRLALSPFEVWGDILTTNAAPVCAALKLYILKLQQFVDCIETDSVPETEGEFQAAARFARGLRDSRL